jgi:hypothetical protein
MKTKNAIFYKILYLGLIVILAATPFNLEGKKTAKGIVFEDTNHNGIFDKGEKGIPNVVVSNQYDAVQTDEKGRFRLPIGRETIIFVTKPTGYDVPLDDNNFPRFYYIHQPKGSPAGLKYKGWDKEKNKKGSYTGCIHERQLTWLKNDLTFVPENYLVVLAMHIPVHSEMYQGERNMIVNRDALFKVLENREHLLALAGHMHFVEYLEFNEKAGWNGKAPFPSLTAGAGCGTWWHGPKDTRGIPPGICTDGTPNGYFLFTFTGNRFNYRFYAPNASPHKQMRINSPTGTLSLQDLEDRKVNINVNVFAGTPHTVVTYQLDNGPETTMKREIMKDPFFTRVINENRDKYKKWMEPTFCSHIWAAPLPGNLKPGIHQLKVTAKDHQGNVFTTYRLFEAAQ